MQSAYSRHSSGASSSGAGGARPNSGSHPGAVSFPPLAPALLSVSSPALPPIDGSPAAPPPPEGAPAAPPAFASPAAPLAFASPAAPPLPSASPAPAAPASLDVPVLPALLAWPPVPPVPSPSSSPHAGSTPPKRISRVATLAPNAFMVRAPSRGGRCFPARRAASSRSWGRPGASCLCAGPERGKGAAMTALPAGAYTALVTPFTPDGAAVDLEAYDRLVEA